GHRFYLEKMATGFAMLFTGGVGGAWWIVDVFLLKRLVQEYNKEQHERQVAGLAPKSLGFMPPMRGQPLPEKPVWAEKRAGKGQLIGGGFALFLSGFCLGAMSAATGNIEAIIAISFLIAITLLGARWDSLATIPLLNGFDRWNHRLRLYYFTTDPGNPFVLALRPVIGIFVAWRQRSRAEVRLYLKLGAWFTLLFTLLDLIEAYDDGGLNAGALLGDMVQNLVMIYFFAAPIGAVLTTQLLLSRTDKVIWSLSIIALSSIAVGGLVAA
ncbi:MAG: TM2 domain-containing protein, partial [Pseudomonadota bacterium]